MQTAAGVPDGRHMVDIQSQSLARRDLLAKAMAIYEDRHLDADGRFPATFRILPLTAWAPAPSQQKPLSPGSAETRLADVLDAEEISLGEKARPKD